MAATMRETVAVKHLSEGVYTAEPFYDAARLANPQPIAYGGIALAQAVSAAWDTLPSPATQSMHLYSIQGTYLGPAATNLPTTYTVQTLRTTRTFATRLVIASQPAPSSSSSLGETTRRILVVLFDWHVPEAPLLAYSTPPIFPIPPLDTLVSHDEYYAARLDARTHAAFKGMFGLILRMFEYRPAPSMGTENALGMAGAGARGAKAKATAGTAPGTDGGMAPAHSLTTSQDGEPLWRRTNCTWVRSRESGLDERERAATTAFLLDGGLAFLPLVIHSAPLTDAAACSSLDISLRLFHPPRIEDWHLLEQHTEHAAHGRTYSVGRLYAADGEEVGVMTQVGILRGKKDHRGAGVGARL